jgi:hypothetical protein
MPLNSSTMPSRPGTHLVLVPESAVHQQAVGAFEPGKQVGLYLSQPGRIEQGAGACAVLHSDRAFLGLIRQWLKAGILETDGAVMHPETGTPQGGVVSPVLANVYLHYALDLPQRLEPGP